MRRSTGKKSNFAFGRVGRRPFVSVSSARVDVLVTEGGSSRVRNNDPRRHTEHLKRQCEDEPERTPHLWGGGQPEALQISCCHATHESRWSPGGDRSARFLWLPTHEKESPGSLHTRSSQDESKRTPHLLAGGTVESLVCAISMASKVRNQALLSLPALRAPGGSLGQAWATQSSTRYAPQ